MEAPYGRNTWWAWSRKAHALGLVVDYPFEQQHPVPATLVRFMLADAARGVAAQPVAAEEVVLLDDDVALFGALFNEINHLANPRTFLEAHAPPLLLRRFVYHLAHCSAVNRARRAAASAVRGVVRRLALGPPPPPDLSLPERPVVRAHGAEVPAARLITNLAAALAPRAPGGAAGGGGARRRVRLCAPTFYPVEPRPAAIPPPPPRDYALRLGAQGLGFYRDVRPTVVFDPDADMGEGGDEAGGESPTPVPSCLDWADAAAAPSFIGGRLARERAVALLRPIETMRDEARLRALLAELDAKLAAADAAADAATTEEQLVTLLELRLKREFALERLDWLPLVAARRDALKARRDALKVLLAREREAQREQRRRIRAAGLRDAAARNPSRFEGAPPIVVCNERRQGRSHRLLHGALERVRFRTKGRRPLVLEIAHAVGCDPSHVTKYARNVRKYARRRAREQAAE